MLNLGSTRKGTTLGLAGKLLVFSKSCFALSKLMGGVAVAVGSTVVPDGLGLPGKAATSEADAMRAAIK